MIIAADAPQSRRRKEGHMNFSVTIISTVTEQHERKVKNMKRDAAKGLRDGQTVTSQTVTPAKEYLIEAENMQEARKEARATLASYAAAHSDDGNVYTARVNYDARAMYDGSNAPAAYAAHSILNKAYDRQAAPFILEAMQSIERGKPNDNASDIMQEAAAAMFDAAAIPDKFRPFVNVAPNYCAYRAAYAAGNAWIRGERKRDATTARQDIIHYLRLSDERADAEAAAQYDGVYMKDADAVAHAEARAAYVEKCAEHLAIIREALDGATRKQRDAVIAYAEAGNMRTAAKRLHVKSVATVAKHISAVRRAVGGKDINLDAYDASDARRKAIRKEAAADIRARAAVDWTGRAAATPAAQEARAAMEAARKVYAAAREAAARMKDAHARAVAAARRAVAAKDADARAMFDAARDATRRADAAIEAARTARAAYVAARTAYITTTEANDDARAAALAEVEAEARARAAALDGDKEARAANMEADKREKEIHRGGEWRTAPATVTQEARAAAAVEWRKPRDAAAAMAAYKEAAAAMEARAAAARK